LFIVSELKKKIKRVSAEKRSEKLLLQGRLLSKPFSEPELTNPGL
jgi:hypothetical protein